MEGGGVAIRVFIKILTNLYHFPKVFSFANTAQDSIMCKMGPHDGVHWAGGKGC